MLRLKTTKDLITIPEENLQEPSESDICFITQDKRRFINSFYPIDPSFTCDMQETIANDALFSNVKTKYKAGPLKLQSVSTYKELYKAISNQKLAS